VSGSDGAERVASDQCRHPVSDTLATAIRQFLDEMIAVHTADYLVIVRRRRQPLCQDSFVSIH